MQRQLFDLAMVLLIIALALFLGELHLRQRAGFRYFCFMVIFLITVGMDIWWVSGR